jgi:hypothetical protein
LLPRLPARQELACREVAWKGVIRLAFWQKCLWAGAALVIVVSLLVITRTAETNSAALPSTGQTTGQAPYYSFQDTSRTETHYVAREGDRTVIYNSVPAGR